MGNSKTSLSFSSWHQNMWNGTTNLNWFKLKFKSKQLILTSNTFVNTICVGHHYAQTNTTNVNKTWALLQTTGGKDDPNIVFMLINSVFLWGPCWSCFFKVYFCVVLWCVFTFWVPHCDVRYDFNINTMFGSSLPPVVCRRANVSCM
jgi:hypothetical protein